MRKAWIIFAFSGVLACGALPLSAGTVQFQVTPAGMTGPGQYQYQYFLSGFDFLANQALDIQFDPALYGTLSSGVAGAGFNLLLLQPNNPVGASGLYSALAIVDHPSLSQTFSVKFSFLGSGVPSGQLFSVDQFDAQGRFIGVVSSGTTVSAVGTVPEPSGFLVTGVSLLVGLLMRRVGPTTWRPPASTS